MLMCVCACRYKASGATLTDATGSRDTAEFINVSRDDALSYPVPTHRTYPSTVNARMLSSVKPFVEKSTKINDALIAVLNDRLGLPEGELGKRHDVREMSGSESRVIRNAPGEGCKEKVVLGEHSDLSSLVCAIRVDTGITQD